MINREKISIYRKFSGDIDAWARSNKGYPISEDEWYLIDSLLQDLLMIKNGLTSQIFEMKVQEKLDKNCDNSSVQQELRSLLK